MDIRNSNTATDSEVPGTSLTSENVATTRVTPSKRSSTSSSPLPSPVKKSGPGMIKLMQDTVDSFSEQMDTQLRATHFSLSVQDTQDVSKTILGMRRTLKDFHNKTGVTLKEVMLKTSADSQKISPMTAYISHLTTEKNELRQNVESLEERIKQNLLFREQVQDGETLAQAFLESDFAFGEDDAPPEKKQKDNLSLDAGVREEKEDN